MIRIAVIGAGGYACDVIGRLLRLPDDYRVVGIYVHPDDDPVSLQAIVGDGVSRYATVADLLDGLQGQCDVVYIPTPIHTHLNLARQVMEAGFDVFLEKPPVATVQDLDLLCGVQAATKRRVAVCFQYMYSDVVQTLQERVLAGEVGAIRSIRSMAGWARLHSYFTRSAWAGRLKVDRQWVLDGTINNPLSHMLALQLYLAAPGRYGLATPFTVEAELYRAQAHEAEDTSSVRIMTCEGVEVCFVATLCPEREVNVEMILDCERATIRYTNFCSAEIRYTDGRHERFESSQHRSRMLQKLAAAYHAGQAFVATPENCRPFTVAVNAAFDSSGGTRAISGQHVLRLGADGAARTAIKGINGYLKDAYERKVLFSRTDAPWALPGAVIDARDYAVFPSRNWVDAENLRVAPASPSRRRPLTAGS